MPSTEMVTCRGQHIAKAKTLNSGIWLPAVFSKRNNKKVLENKMHTPFFGLHSKPASHIGLLFYTSGTHLQAVSFSFFMLNQTVFGIYCRFFFVCPFFLIVIGFTGQVKKIWQEHIFFIFDGGKNNGFEVWFWKLQVGRVEGVGLGRGGVSTIFKPRTNWIHLS